MGCLLGRKGGKLFWNLHVRSGVRAKILRVKNNLSSKTFYLQYCHFMLFNVNCKYGINNIYPGDLEKNEILKLFEGSVFHTIRPEGYVSVKINR